MAVVKATVNKRMAEALGMSDGGDAFGTWTGKTWKTTDADEAILAADAAVISGFIQTVGNGRRQPFETASSTAHGALIASHAGPIGAVIFTITGGLYAGTCGGKLVSKQEVEQDNATPQVLAWISPKYAIEGGRLYHNAEALIKGGASAVAVTVDICGFTLTTACQAPDEAYQAVFDGAMAIVHKNGNHTESAGAYRQAFQGDLMLLGVSPDIAAKLSLGIDERAQGAQA